MPYYKNIGLSSVTYFGVTINPGQIKKLPCRVIRSTMQEIVGFVPPVIKTSDTPSSAKKTSSRKQPQERSSDKSSAKKEESSTTASVSTSVKDGSVKQSASPVSRDEDDSESESSGNKEEQQ